MSRITSGNNGITQKYSDGHKAVDIGWHSNEADNNVLAHSSGKVVFCQTGQKNNTTATGNASYGNCVKIQHSNGYYTLYAHLKSVNVKLNQNVSQGQVIGVIGITGRAFGRHLHFELRNKDNVRIDPTNYINADLPSTTSTSTTSSKTLTLTTAVYGRTGGIGFSKVKTLYKTGTKITDVVMNVGTANGYKWLKGNVNGQLRYFPYNSKWYK